MNETVKIYAERKAREEARKVIAKLLLDASNDVLLNVVFHLINEVNSKDPVRVYDMEFIDVLESFSHTTAKRYE